MFVRSTGDSADGYLYVCTPLSCTTSIDALDSYARSSGWDDLAAREE